MPVLSRNSFPPSGLFVHFPDNHKLALFLRQEGGQRHRLLDLTSTFANQDCFRKTNRNSTLSMYVPMPWIPAGMAKGQIHTHPLSQSEADRTDSAQGVLDQK